MARELTLIVGLLYRRTLTHIISRGLHDSPVGNASLFPYFIGEGMRELPHALSGRDLL